ncbi:hypothetical protein, conserved [Trypanosoma brucei gambiense DAL972]|uniref:Uncharacterized protein n=1 Tax=Trypanosoma brucei gambiense (strain MHOM/CI/86/DAL972) TaxID=679716 RepID=C9ZTV0_TRYB9|nr:hypothetical protein, conserved [Trypanosoma brucei gambiense DAL972]CBH12836.1 hypothetical protein, conserved [Trypanosoma brucei gambiense DAL972]|eukprot:XP_011775115.1 hypothetical protein, conserved [Trypanosoma brucei gambiense DAL972]
MHPTSFPTSSFKPVAFRRGVLPDVYHAATGDLFDHGDSNPHSITETLAAMEEGQQQHVAAQQQRVWHSYPTIPYYSPMQGMQLVISVDGVGEASAGDPSDAVLLKSLPKLQEVLHETVAKHGNVYYLSSLPANRNALLHPYTTAAPQAATADLDYWRYLQGLQDAFMKLVELRDECVRESSRDACTHHILLVRVASHPRLKDVALLLSVEKCRLCLCLSASSKVAQQYFTQRAQDVGVELVWVLGSTLITEPECLSMADINPVFALWDVFVNMHLYTTVTDGGEAGSVGGPNGNASMKSGVNNVISRDGTEGTLRHVDITVMSSIRFSGCDSYAPALRLSDVGQLSGGGRRLLWALVGSLRVVMPHFVAALVRSLVEHSVVERFELRFDHGLPGSAASAGGASEGGAATAGRGVVYVTGGRRGIGGRRGLPHGLTFRSFSRLSAEFWLSDEDRRECGLIVEGDPTPLECEFVVDSIRYNRKLWEEQEECEVGRYMTNENGELLQPLRWGRCFQAVIGVERIIDEQEE